MSRTSKSLKNIMVVLIGQGIGTLIAFIARTLFIKFLSKEYLGIDGLFTNILTVLSLTELGVGEAITYSLYKPLAEKNEEKIVALMKLFKKIYTIIGILILIAGIAIAPFIENFLNEKPNINENLQLIFIFFVINSALSYFYSYKKSLLIADQNKYITTIYKYVCYFFLNVLQLIVLYITHNYYLYLILLIINTLIENILISRGVNKMYPYLKKYGDIEINHETKEEIIKNTKALMLHKIGSTVVKSTDNILISKLIGIVEVGIYSNYYLITNAFVTIINQIFNAVLASVGNLGATETNKKKLQVFNAINFMNFLIYSFVTGGLLILFNPFISVWVGKDFLFGMPVVISICVNFYLTGMRRTVIIFRDALGLYWYDRYKAIFEAIINLIFSILLAKVCGIVGIFLGTMISTVTCCIFIEPYVLYKHGFNMSSKRYFMNYFKYMIITIIELVIMQFLASIVNYLGFSGLTEIGIKLIICLVIPNIINYIIFNNTEEFNYFKEIAKKLLDNLKNKRKKLIIREV